MKKTAQKPVKKTVTVKTTKANATKDLSYEPGTVGLLVAAVAVISLVIFTVFAVTGN